MPGMQYPGNGKHTGDILPERAPHTAMAHKPPDRAGVSPIRFPGFAPPVDFQVRLSCIDARHVRLRSVPVPPPDATDSRPRPGLLRVAGGRVRWPPPLPA